MKGLIPFKQFYFANFKTTVKVVSWFLQKQNNLVGQLKRFEIIVRHSLEISLRMTSWPPNEQQLWIRYRWAELVTLAPGLRPERRFAPLAWGLTL